MQKAGILAFLLFFSMVSLALGATTNGNEARGEYLYKKNCKSCHTQGDIGGKISPNSKTIAEWTQIIDSKSHPKGEIEVIAEKDLNDISTFVIKHASDSADPRVCY